MPNLRNDIRQTIDAHRSEILALLKRLVACNSFSHNKRGVDEVGRMVAEDMPRCFEHEVVKTERLGDHHLYTHKGPGGLAANAVAEHAMMDFEFRYWDGNMERELRGTLGELGGKATVPGCTLRLERLSYRPPMQPSAEAMQLVGLIQELSAAMGQSVVPEKRGGVSDANWLAHVGIPTIDGLGPLGDGDFTRDEYIITETLFQRIELTANLLLTLKENGLLR